MNELTHPLVQVLNTETQDLLTKFLQKIVEWNEKINLISRQDIERIEERHLLPSLAFLKVAHFQPVSHVLDIGTGGGFPGCVLGICCPEIQFTLVDTVGKKIKVLADIIETLGLKNIHLVHGRVENMTQTFDYVLGRAVTAVPVFLNWAFPRLKPKGEIFYLKGGILEPEVMHLNYQQYVLNELLGSDAYPDKYILHFYR